MFNRRFVMSRPRKETVPLPGAIKGPPYFHLSMAW